jgi:predicted transcriptional regulator
MNKEVSLLLKNWREKLGFSVNQMAYYAGVSPQTIYNTENGKTKPSSDYLVVYLTHHIQDGKLISDKEIETKIEAFKKKLNALYGVKEVQ